MEGISNSKHAEELLRDFPPIPDELKIQANDLFDNYIFYKRNRKGEMECTCTSCYEHWSYPERTMDEHDLKIFNSKHNDNLFCPHCGKLIILKCLSRFKTLKRLTQYRNVVFFHGDGNLIYATAATIEKSYIDTYREMDLYLQSKVYYTFEPGETHSWRYEYKCDHNGYKLCETKKIAIPFCNGGRYPTEKIGFNNVLNGFLKYSWAQGYCIDGRDAILYAGEYCVHPQLEFIAKMGFDEILNETILQRVRGGGLLNWKAKTPAEFFRMPKTDFNALVKHARSADLNALKLYRKARKCENPISIEELYQYKEDSKLDVDIFITVAAENRISYVKLFNYLCKMKCENTGTKLNIEKLPVSLYRDYIDMAKKIKLDLTQSIVMFPKNLRTAHDKAVEAFNALKIESEKADGEKLYKKLYKKYYYENDKYIIRPPYCAAEIIAEGQTLKHCVAGYANRHMKGQTIILFVRERDCPNTPYFTVEMDGTHMNQFYGYKDKRPDNDDLKAFAAEFLDKLGADKQKKKRSNKSQDTSIPAVIAG